MLLGIKKWITPELLKYLSEMGHGDEIVIADANFPACSTNKKVVECKGNDATEMLEEILKLIPLDNFVSDNLIIMDNEKKEGEEIWKEFELISIKNEHFRKLTKVKRFEFYERSKNAFCIVSTGEERIYANIIITKGVIK
jgi:L-fucose mutarotase